MNIIWTIETSFETNKSSNIKKTMSVSPSDRWNNISLSKPNRRHLKDFETVDITHKGEIFRGIPTNWYMIEN